MSRARPTDKQRLVAMLQKRGEVVAVTGDGTNDAPALHYAHVGLSLGSGTSVAKEASDMTLLDDSFKSIANAVMWGRSLYRNLQRFLFFQLVVNVAALLLVLGGSVIGTEMPLTVTQILWVNLIMDTFAALALASLPPSHEVMSDKPRKASNFIINKSIGFGIRQMLHDSLFGAGYECLLRIAQMKFLLGFRLRACLKRNFRLYLLYHLLAVGKKGIDANFQLLKLERLGDVGIRSGSVSLRLVLFLVLGGKQDDRQLPETLVRLELLGQLDTVHDRHHHIAHHQVELLFHDDVHRLLAVLCRKHMIVLAQNLKHQGEQFLVVLYHQDLACILTDEDALADWCQLRLVIGSWLGIQLRFLTSLSDGFLIYCIWSVCVVYLVRCIRFLSDRKGDGEGSAFAFMPSA